MRQPSLLRRYILFFCGVLCAALGIALITLAGMGTSAVSSLSYVLTFVFPGLSLGVFTFLVNCTMLVGQVLLLRHRFQSIQLLQIPATLLFSVCIDLWTELLAPLVPESYGARWVVLLLGCLSLGLGIGCAAWSFWRRRTANGYAAPFLVILWVVTITFDPTDLSMDLFLILAALVTAGVSIYLVWGEVYRYADSH